MLHMGLLESSLSSLLPNATFCQGIKALKASTTTKTTGLTGLQVWQTLEYTEDGLFFKNTNHTQQRCKPPDNI